MQGSGSPSVKNDISPILHRMKVLTNSPLHTENHEMDLSALSADRTIVSSQSPSDVPKYKRRALDLIPAQLMFDQESSQESHAPSGIVMDLSTTADFEPIEDDTSMLRESQGIRHLEEDTNLKTTACGAIVSAQQSVSFEKVGDVSPSPCFTPTGCGIAPYPWDDTSTGACSQNSLSGTRTPKLSRPLKKMHTIQHFSADRGDHNVVDAVPRDSLMEQQDFTSLLRSASDLDYTGHYMYVELLGRGSFGEVWSVRHHRSGKLFALKKSMRQFRGRRDRDAYIREIHCVARLTPHKNIVRYERAWQDAGHFYIVMELCTGGTLRSLIDRDQCIPLDRILSLIRGCVCGLEQLHANGLLHLDLKPDNLFLSDDGGIKIGDFGLCLPATEWDSEEGDCAYLAPEVLNEQATSAADVFSAGLILYQLLMGVPLLPGHGQEWQRLRSGQNLFDQIPMSRRDQGQQALWSQLTQVASCMLTRKAEDRPSAVDCCLKLSPSISLV